MRIKYFLRISLAAALLAGAASCQKDSARIFDDSSAVRMKENLSDVAKVLTSPQYGWYLEYFLKESLTGATTGGYSMLLKFEGNQVTAWGDAAGSPKSYTSLYKLTTDDGPILSFDSYNEVIHYFSTPSGNGTNYIGQTGHYRGLGGDFEFLIMDAKPECVVLKGKRCGINMRMYPLTQEPSKAISRIIDVSKDIYVSSFITPDKTFKADFDLEKRHVAFSAVTEEGDVALLDTPYMYSEDGVRLPDKTLGELVEKALKGDAGLREKVAGVIDALKGGELFASRNFTWDRTNKDLVAGGSKLEGVLPEGWLSYEEYLGDYSFYFGESGKEVTVDCSLVQDVYRSSFTLTGLNPNFNLKVDYSLATGNLAIMGQTLGEDDTYTYWWSAWAKDNGGSLWYDTKYGMKTVLDQESYAADPAHFTLKLVPGPSATGKPCDSFIIYQRNNETKKGSNAPSKWYVGGTNKIAYPKTLTKK